MQCKGIDEWKVCHGEEEKNGFAGRMVSLHNTLLPRNNYYNYDISSKQ